MSMQPVTIISQIFLIFQQFMPAITVAPTPPIWIVLSSGDNQVMKPFRETHVNIHAMYVGTLICALSIFCFIPNCYVIYVTLQTAWMRCLVSYKLLLALCFLNLPLIVSYFITGILTISPISYTAFILESCGTIVVSCYMSYCTFTAILALNRFINWISPYFNDIFFSSFALMIWFVVGLAPAAIQFIVLSSPTEGVSYSRTRFYWHYDKRFSDSIIAQRIEMFVELTTTVTTVLIYIAFLLKMAKHKTMINKTKKPGDDNTQFHANKMHSKTLIQTIGISLLCFVLNISWHVITKRSTLFNATLTFVLILNSAVTPLATIWAVGTYRRRLTMRRRTMSTSTRDIFGLSTRHPNANKSAVIKF